MYSLDELKELIKLLEDSKLTAIELSDEANTVRIEKEPAAVAAPQVVNVPQNQPQAAASETPAAAIPQGKTIDCPMVGVFYAAPNPDSKPFVTVGQEIKKGDIVCIIEAMKIMNEITAEESGTVTEVLVNNGDVVEYGQPMFRLG